MKKLNVPLKIVLPLLIGVFLVILASILGATTQKTSVVPAMERSKDTTSNTNIREAYNYNFTIKEDQHIQIILSSNSMDDTVNLKVVPRALFDEFWRDNATKATNTITGLNMITYTRSWGNGPSGAVATVLTCAWNGIQEVEAVFGGTTQNDVFAVPHVVSVPGDYTLVVYGTDATGAPSDTDVTFTVEVIAEGPGLALKITFIILGYGLVIIGIVLALLEYRPPLFFGGDEE
jgi:hypothetical protein